MIESLAKSLDAIAYHSKLRRVSIQTARTLLDEKAAIPALLRFAGGLRAPVTIQNL